MPRPTDLPAAIVPAGLLVAGLLGGSLLGACGGSSTTSTTSSATSTTSSATSTTSSTAATSLTTSSTGGGTSSRTGAPVVSNAANLKVAPVPKAGTSPAPTALVKKDLVVGSGPTAGATSTVRVQYVGADYANGKVFDSSWSRGQPATFPLNGVIPGFAQGIVGMKVGGRRELVIPPALGYGAAGSGPVGPNETLVFVIDLLAVQ